MKLKRLISMALAFCLVFSCFVSLGSVETYAASVKTPAKVTGLKAVATQEAKAEGGVRNVVTITWAKAKYATGYQVYLFGEKEKTTTACKYVVKGFKSSLKVPVKVRAYRKYKQYYNSKKKKWVNSKPKKSQWKGKKTRTKFKYGKFTSTSVTTKAAPKEPVGWPEFNDEAKQKIIQAIHDGPIEYNDAADFGYYTEHELLSQMAQEIADKAAKDGKVTYVFKDELDDERLTAEFGEYGYKYEITQGRNLKTFDDLEAIYNSIEDIPFYSGVWTHWTQSYEYVGVGYCKGYLCIIVLYER